MLNTMIVAAITNFSGTTTPDKNGETPIMLQCIAGQMPNRNVLSGTVGMRAGFEVGKTYLINVRETGYDDIYGPDFTFVKVMELTSGLDIVKAVKEIGEPKILFVQRPEGFDNVYQRKGDAVESNRAKRIKEGTYHPAYPTTIGHHETATRVVRGSSQNSGGTLNVHDLVDMDMEFPEPEGHQDYFPEPGDETSDVSASAEHGDESLHQEDEEEHQENPEANDENQTDNKNQNGNQNGNRRNRR